MQRIKNKLRFLLARLLGKRNITIDGELFITSYYWRGAWYIAGMSPYSPVNGILIMGVDPAADKHSMDKPE